jgi:Gamma-glutamyl cyclotransferase, AIG2-like
MRQTTYELMFAYGSNLSLDAMRYRAPGAVPVAPARLDGWALRFHGGVSNIVERDGGCVEGGVWAITPDDRRALDRYEGAPTFYEPRTLPVRLVTNGAVERALVYVIPEVGGSDLSPAPEYLETIRRGLRTWGWAEFD